LKYINTSIANTKACKKPTKSSIVTTINGIKNGTFIKAIVPTTISVKRTAHANIFQNSLRVNDSILVISPTNSSKPINNHSNMSKSFMGNLYHLSILTIHTPFNGKYLSKNLKP